MSTASPAARELARRLIAHEAARAGASGASGSDATRVVDTLRASLSKLVGGVGFRVLVGRALALAKVEDPSLVGVAVRPDGSLEGMAAGGRILDGDGGVVVVAHLLGLMATFVGEPITLGLVRDAWPDAAGAGFDGGRGEEL